MLKGHFITFEGIDGVGKTTQSQQLVQSLEDAGHSVVCTREPGGTRLGQLIRGLLLDSQLTDISQQAEILLYAADRAQHVQEVLKPNLEAGKIVISDRYLDSSIAYQGYGLGWDIERIREINRWAIAGIYPGITICLDQEPRIALSKTGGDRIESRAIDYYQRVRSGYCQIAKNEPDRFHLVSAEGTIDEVFQRIWQIIKGRIF